MLIYLQTFSDQFCWAEQIWVRWLVWWCCGRRCQCWRVSRTPGCVGRSQTGTRAHRGELRTWDTGDRGLGSSSPGKPPHRPPQVRGPARTRPRPGGDRRDWDHERPRDSCQGEESDKSWRAHSEPCGGASPASGAWDHSRTRYHSHHTTGRRRHHTLHTTSYLTVLCLPPAPQF